MTDEYRWYLLAKKRYEDSILAAFRGLRREGIEPILIKGWAAARNYPDDKPRFSGDVDLAVSAADHARTERLINERESEIRGVDLHRELRHLDTRNWAELMVDSELVPLDGEQIRVLASEDHLRILCVHWLTNGGESRERLWDIYYAVHNRPQNFDWRKCLEAVSENRRGWIIATIGLAHKYLGLDVEDLPFRDAAKHLPAWLTACVEREWERETRLRPLHTTLTDLPELWRQVRKRVPPNPIQATIDCEGSFDDRGRLRYQVRDIFKRLGPSLSRVVPSLFGRYDGR
jgi:hypothetical protein